MEERFKTFTVLMSKLRRNIQRIKAEEMAEYDLKCPHVSCLYYLYKEGPMTAKQLCDICDEDKAAVSRSVDQLEKRGYVECPEEPKKRYRAKIKLTEEGKSIARGVAQKVDKILDFAGEGISEEDRGIFYRSLQIISSNLEKICDKYED